MLDLPLVLHASPTLSGLKSAALFSFAFPDHQEMTVTLLRQNRVLSAKGLHLLPLCCRGSRVPLYLYRTTLLVRDLSHPKTRTLLSHLGYPAGCAGCIAHLMKRIRTHNSFPHEIGLFLGYPLGDVLGFMHDPSAYLCSGCWKVYENTAQAQALFAQYKKCTQYNQNQLSRGVGLEALICPG